MTAATIAAPTALTRRSREALSALAVEFLLGMAVNLIPRDGASVLHPIALGAHVLIAVGILVVAIRLLLAARRDRMGATEAVWGLVVVVLTVVAGVLTIVLHSGWFSFAMAAGFLASALIYVRTLLLGTSRSTAS